MIKEAHLGPIETRVMAMRMGRAHALAFAHVINVFVLAIFCILWYIFLLNVANYAFTFLFNCINLRGIVPGPTQGVGKGRLTLCGPNGGMWT